jgi:hypothetical protein
MTNYTKIAIACILLVTVGCTATLIIVSKSDDITIDTHASPKLDSGLDIDIKRDTLTQNK